MSEPLGVPVCVWYYTEGGSATGAPNALVHDGSGDYVARVGKFVKIPAGKVVGTISVTTLYDSAQEGDESFSVVVDMVSAMTGSSCNTFADPAVTVVASRGLVTIVDDDPAPAAPTVSIGDATVPEGQATTNGSAKLGVRLSQPQAGTICVWYDTEDGSATGAPNATVHGASTDYVTRAGKFVKIPGGCPILCVGGAKPGTGGVCPGEEASWHRPSVRSCSTSCSPTIRPVRI